jgi:DNA-binding response OmpR family regulator
MNIRCVNCGQEHYTRPIVDLQEGVMIWQWRAIQLVGVKAHMAAFMVENMGRPLTYDEMAEAMWGHPDRWPNQWQTSIRQQIFLLRECIAKLGLKIICRRQFGYEMVTAESIAERLKHRLQPIARSEVLESA